MAVNRSVSPSATLGLAGVTVIALSVAVSTVTPVLPVTAVATIDPAGLATALTTGTAQITASAGSVAGSTTLTVP